LLLPPPPSPPLFPYTTLFRSCSRDSLTPSSSHACVTLTLPRIVSSSTRRRLFRSSGPSNRSTCPTPSGGRLIGSPPALRVLVPADRKSTRLNSSHDQISYAVF